jgi:hypothetical protein
MRLAVEEVIQRPPDVVFDFVGREHWQNHPRWDPNVTEITPLTAGPIGLGSRARVRRRRGGGRHEEILEVTAFEPNSRWAGRSQVGPFSLEMTALIEPVGAGASRLRLMGDTQARPPIHYLLPVLDIVFRRRMRESLRRIRNMVEAETTDHRPESG